MQRTVYQAASGDTELLGRAAIPDLPYEQLDGTPLRIDADYFCKQRAATNPVLGSLGNPFSGALWLNWP